MYTFDTGELGLSSQRTPAAWVLERETGHKLPRRKPRDRAGKSMSALEPEAVATAATAVPPKAIQPKHEAKDPGVTWLEQEIEDGNVEYKYKVDNPNPMRLQQLITQMKFRLSEGKGECFYYVGVEDDGYPRGLEPAELDASVATISAMARTLRASAALLHHVPGGFGRRGALLHVTFNASDELSYTDLRIAVAGSMDAGKSTLVAVLTHGADGRPLLDNGRGSARMSVFRHKHEIESGHTSSISQQMVGYDAAGRVLNYAGVSALLPAEISAAAARVCTFIDMGGHEKCLKTALYGLTCMLPDYMLLCVCSTARISRITREHLAVALALEVPIAVVITKSDAVDDAQLQAVLADVRQLLSTAVRGSKSSIEGLIAAASDSFVAPVVEGGKEAAETAAALSRLRGSGGSFWQRSFPVFMVSCVSGAGLATLHAFLGRLQPGAEAPAGAAAVSNSGPVAVESLTCLDEWDPLCSSGLGEQDSAWPLSSPGDGRLVEQGLISSGLDVLQPVHFQVLHTFDVEDVGSVVWGTLVSGTIEIGQHLMWGPNAYGGFTPVAISCIQRFHIAVKQVRAGQTATLALQPIAIATTSSSNGGAAADSVLNGKTSLSEAADSAAGCLGNARRASSPLEAALLDTGYREAAPGMLAAIASSGRAAGAGVGVDEALAEQMLLEAIEADDKQGPEHWRGKPAAQDSPLQQEEEEEGPTWYLADSGQVSDSSEASSDTEDERSGGGRLAAAVKLAASTVAVRTVAASSTSSFSSSAPAHAGSSRSRRRRGSRSSSDRSSDSSGVDMSCDTTALVSESSSSFFALEALALEDTLTTSNGSSTGQHCTRSNDAAAAADACNFSFDVAQFDVADLAGGLCDNGASWNSALDLLLPARHSASCGSLAASQRIHSDPGHTHRTASTCSLPACMARSTAGTAAALGGSPPASPRQLLGSSPSNWRKGAVLLDAAMQPETLWAFEAVLVLLGGTWPARGLLSGCWPPLDADPGAALSSSQGSGVAAALSRSAPSSRSVGTELRSPGKAVRAKRADYTYVVHCNSVRQVARVEAMQEVAEHGGLGKGARREGAASLGPEAGPEQQQRWSSSGPVQLPSSIRAAAALLQASRNSDTSGSESGPPGFSTGGSAATTDVGSVVVARFRFVHRPEWLKEGARLIVRDRSDGGHFAAAGYIRALVPGQQGVGGKR